MLSKKRPPSRRRTLHCSTNPPDPTGYKWPEMPATVCLYARMGNRTDYENIRRTRLPALQALVYGEFVENEERFLDAITNGMWATCEESFWVFRLTSIFRMPI